MKLILIFTFMFSFCLHSGLYSQKHPFDHFNIAFTTLHTAFPFGSFSSLFTKEFHPGIEAGTGFNWKAKGEHIWFQEFKLGYSYQRFVQHSFALYTEFVYRHQFLKSFYGESSIGAGYLHAISTEKVFKLNNDGTYRKTTNIGRPQGMASFNIGAGKKISSRGLILFLNYQQRLQFPFIRSYVPLLPANMLMIGIQLPVKSK